MDPPEGGNGHAGDAKQDNQSPLSRRVDRLRFTLYEYKPGADSEDGRAIGDHVPDYCCVAKLDGTEIARTQTAQTRQPYWNEDFQFHVQSQFGAASFYVYANKTPIGKVSFPYEQLYGSAASDEWCHLQTVDERTEVTGQVRLDISIAKPSRASGKPTLVVNVAEGTGFAPEELYVVVEFVDPETKQLQRMQGKVSARTSEPQWHSGFMFTLGNVGIETNESGEPTLQGWGAKAPAIKVSVFNSSDVFRGQVLAKVTSSQLHETSEWYAMAPHPPSSFQAQSQPSLTLGALRLKVEFTSDQVLAKAQYDPLVKLLLSSLNPGSDFATSPVALLAKHVKNKEAAARCLVRVCSEHEKGVAMVSALADNEIQMCGDNAATVFRGNTLATKSIDQFMKLHGTDYLRTTLELVLHEIFENQPSCEIDPTRIDDNEDLDANLASLTYYVNRTLIAILASSANCPTDFRRLFYRIQTAATKQFPDVQGIQHVVISAFIFLRFFAPAVMSPKLFGLTHKQPSPKIARCLTLLSKTVQNLGNTNRDGVAKEAYMQPINDQVVTKNRDKIVQFLETVGSLATQAARQLAPKHKRPPLVFKEGYLTKRGQGRKMSLMGMSVSGLKNFKRRYFVLDEDGLTYHKDQGEDAIFRVRTEVMLAVEKVDESTFGMPFMFQVVQPDSVLYMAAENAPDQREWLSALRQVSRAKAMQREQFHPGAFLGGQWTCCKVKSETSLVGCKRCTRETSESISRIWGEIDDDCLVLQQLSAFCEGVVAASADGLDEAMRPAWEDMNRACQELKVAHTACRSPLARQGSRQRPHTMYVAPLKPG